MSDPESAYRTRPSLLLRLRDAGDNEAWQAFVDTYAPLLYHWCRRHALQDTDAADVSQETLLQVARCIRTFEYQPERGRFRDWLGMVIRRRIGRFHEQRGRHELTATVSNDEINNLSGEADPEWIAEFNAQVLRVALEKIRPEFAKEKWQVFEQTWLANRSIAEAASEAGMSVQAVYLARHRILERLKEEVLRLAEDLPNCVPLF
jgi:RNA polymerase sigma-70 factor (ECF subfamily)